MFDETATPSKYSLGHPGEPVRRVLVTGATSGIGRAAARRFAELGWEVFATGRSEAGRRALAAELGEGAAHVLELDVDQPASIAACRSEVLALTEGHGVDVIVNNAGFARVSPIAELTDDDLRSHFETNVFGLVAVTRAFLPGMMERGAGRIINVSSSGGRMSLPFVGAYHAAKFAVEALSDAMRWELAPFGVRVSVIEPGPVRTAFVDHVIDSANAVSFASLYAPALGDFAKLQRLAERSMIEPEVVVRDIVHAASATRPRARYMAPRMLALVIALANVVPTWLLDRVIGRMFGLDRVRRRPRSRSVLPMYRRVPPCPEPVPQRAALVASRVARRLGLVSFADELALVADGLGWQALRPFPGYTGRPHRASAEAGAAFARAIVETYRVAAEDVLFGTMRSPRPIMRWLPLVTLGGRLGPKVPLTAMASDAATRRRGKVSAARTAIAR